jgi:RNA polymerase sigma-70 factor, ECF subfamily
MNGGNEIYGQLLVLRCQAGDEAALGELIERYSPGLRFFLRKITGQLAEADDLLQETWMDVYRKINGLRNPEAVTAWIYRIARDKAYRHMRRRRPANAPIDEHAMETLIADEDAFAPEDAEAVRAALDQIPLEQREVLVLRFIEQMSYAQISQVIERPIGTVRSRIHHAKKALGEIFQSKAFGKDMP